MTTINVSVIAVHYFRSYLPASGSPIIGSNYSDPYILLLYIGAMMQDLAVDQHSTWNGSVLNNP